MADINNNDINEEGGDGAANGQANNNNQQPPQPQQENVAAPPFAFPQIQDIDGWLQFNGLRSADEYPATEEPAAFGSFLSALNRSEAQAKYAEEERYQNQVHTSIFKEALQAEQQKCEEVKLALEQWKEEGMEITAKDHKVFRVPLSKLAAECDTVYALASSRRYMPRLSCNSRSDPSSTAPSSTTASSSSHPELNGSGDISAEKNQQMNTNNHQADQSNANKTSHNNSSNISNNMVQLSLEEYSSAAVQEFLALALYLKPLADIQEEFVVDCCHMAHFLQCQRVLDSTTQILLRHVDSDNCLSLCQMADQLELPDLFERALFHMLKSLDHLESHETYEDFSPELKDRIADIRAVFTNHRMEKTSTKDNLTNNNMAVDNNDPQSGAPSSNHHNKKQLYFTSLDEYIAIFAENVQYHRERLEEAKEQNSADYSSYAQTKIEKQELRVLTLETMLAEQKRLFGKKQSNYSTNKRPRF